MRTLVLVWLVLVATAGTAAPAGAQGVIGGSVNGLPQAPPRDPRAKPLAGTGAISGRVTAGDTGVPLRRAVVSLGGPQRMRTAHTDHEGRYTFTNLPPGHYTIFVSPGPHRAGYQATPYGASGSGSQIAVRKPIELADGQQIDDADVALLRTGVITGRVTDTDGEPASRVQVGAWLLRLGAEPSQTGGAQTDDLGQFRIFGLQPGDYILMTNAPASGGVAEVEGEAIGFAPTYAPGTPVQAEAMRLRVTRGAEISADIRLVETRVYAITGMIVNSKGEATRNTSVMLVRKEGTASSYGAAVAATGTFTIRNVAPGQYDLIARSMPAREPGVAIQGPDPAQEYASVSVEVSHGNVDGVVIATRPGATVTGQIVFDEAPPDGVRATLFAQPTDRRPFMGSPLIDVKEGVFTLRNAFSPVVIRGSTGGGPAWGLKAVLLRGKDITDEPTTFTASDSGHLQVVFTAKAPALEGMVTDETGKPVAEASIVLFGHDPSTWQLRSSYYRTSRVLKEGRFMIPGLREGRYYAVAVPVDVLMNISQPNAEMLEALSKVATAVTLNAGEKRPVDLVLVRFQEQQELPTLNSQLPTPNSQRPTPKLPTPNSTLR